MTSRPAPSALLALVAWALLAVACGSGGVAADAGTNPPARPSATATTAPPQTTTTAPPPTTMPAPSTTRPPATTTTTIAPTTTTTTAPPTTTTTTTTAPPVSELVLGTMQLVMLPFGDGVVLPDTPIGGSLHVKGDGVDIVVPFEDPQPGGVFGDGSVSITVRTFAVALPPGDYEIDRLELSHAALGAEPVRVFLAPWWSARFTVHAGGCTDLGDMTFIWWRLPPEDAGFGLVAELGVESVVLIWLDTGNLAWSDAGTRLLDGVVDLDLSGHSWWSDGEQVDAATCSASPAEF